MKCPEQVNRQRVSGYQELRDDEGVITKGHRISLGVGVVKNVLNLDCSDDCERTW